MQEIEVRNTDIPLKLCKYLYYTEHVE